MLKLSTFVKPMLALMLGCFVSTSTLANNELPIGLVIHGGAGTISQAKMTPELQQAYQAKLQEALTAGYQILAAGGQSLDAVEKAITILEDSPLFNAGRGAVYTFDEAHELDASIMDGRDLSAGAVAGVKTVQNPIKLARKVMTDSVHVLLAGAGAEQFADQFSLTRVENSYFDTEKRLEALKRAKEKLASDNNKDYQAAHQLLAAEFKMGTVGAVALDKAGNLAAGTSTGGMTAKRWGRVGDSPIIGAGTYADNEKGCAVSATGHGEFFIRYNVAADICARKSYLQLPLADAANQVINQRLQAVGGTGGVIAIDRQGNVAMPFNTSGMYRASRTSSTDMQIAIFK